MHGRRRFLTLEAMRGVAAICVVLMHGHMLFGALAPTGSYLAVDFFFLLSGFIMAHVYGDALDGGLGGWPFLRMRMIRFYPLYLAGTLSTIALAGASVLLRHDNSLWAYCQPFASLPFAVWMLPSPATDQLFPLNSPAWTLLLEVAANAAFAWGAWRRTTPLLVTATVSGIALLVSGVVFGTMDLGWNFRTGAAGVARVFLSFPLGILLYRCRHRVRMPAAFGLAAPLLLVALLFAGPEGGQARVAYDFVFIVAASPVLLLAAASREPSDARLVRLCVFLGVISYPLYILHYSTELAVAGAIQRHVPAGIPAAAAGLAMFAGMVVVAKLAAGLDWRLRTSVNRRLPRWMRNPADAV